MIAGVGRQREWVASGTFHPDGDVKPKEPVSHVGSMTWPLLVTNTEFS